MTKVSTEMPSRAQQSSAGTDSTNACSGGLASARGTVRMTPADGTLAGWTLLDLSVESEVTPMRAVSLRGPTWTPRFSSGAFIGGMPGLGGAGGFNPDGGGGGKGVFTPAGGGGVFGGWIAPGGAGAGGRAIGGAGGRLPGAPPDGASGFGATDGGGGRRSGGETRPAAMGGFGGRLGRLMRVVSFFTGTAGRFGVRGGKVIRTVSFFGSFESAIQLGGTALRDGASNVSLRHCPECQSPIRQASKS
jgi:hypothetical protein